MIIYSDILSKYLDRLFLHKKLRKLFKDVELKIDLNRVDYIHAHTWYSDGGLAFNIFRKYQIPYIVTVRNTDLNLFQKYLIHEHSFGCKILKNAQKIILISPSYKERLLAEKSLISVKSIISQKIELIPNGIDDFWIQNFVNYRKGIKNPVNILYIGKFNKGKNILNLQRAVKEINTNVIKVHLHLIGGGGDVQSNVLKVVSKNSEFMFYYGTIHNKIKLKYFFDQMHIFAMPSRAETFGLVFIESLLQGVPILYTQNEGVDGLYNENIGEKVRSFDVDEIKLKLLKMINSYSEYVIPTRKILRKHDWSFIAQTYYSIYNTR